MKPLVMAGVVVGVWVGGFGVAPVRAEQVELVTFFPSPVAATPPTTPYTVYAHFDFVLVTSSGPPPLPMATRVYDVYSVLQLWRYGVTRSQVQGVRWRMLFENGVPVGGGGWTPLGQEASNRRVHMVNGALTLSAGHGQSGNIIAEVEVTW